MSVAVLLKILIIRRRTLGSVLPQLVLCGSDPPVPEKLSYSQLLLVLRTKYYLLPGAVNCH
jgi:hypothetical protein